MTAKPNLLFIMSDQQHYRAIGCADPHFDTPHWDAFAAEAVRFDTVYCTTALCTPSRASLLTGLVPPRTGIRDNGQELAHPTIAPLLQAAGYRTGWVGKWHLKENEAAVSGWDFARGVCDEYRKPNRPLSDEETLSYAEEFLTPSASDDRPFALFVSFDQPHGVYWADPNSPYPPDMMTEPDIRPDSRLPHSWFAQDFNDAPVDIHQLHRHQPNTAYSNMMADDENQWKRYREVYRACVQDYDQYLGAVLEKVKALGAWEDTVIIVTSDHGDMDAYHRLCFKGPVAYEQVQRVPLTIRVPQRFGGLPPCVDTRSLVSLVDLPVTLCELAGTKLTNSDGHSLVPLLRGERETHDREEAIIWYPNPTIRTIRRGPWKFTDYPGLGEYLYQLENDPEELQNCIADPSCIEIAESLRERLRANS